MINKNYFIISIILLPVFFCVQLALGGGVDYESHIRAKSAGEVNHVQNLIRSGLVVTNTIGGPVKEIEREINAYGKQNEAAVKKLIAKLIDFICAKDKQHRQEAAKVLYELSKDKWYEYIMCSIGGGKMVGLIRLIPFEQEFDFIVPDFGILTDDLTQQQLREIFNAMEEGVYVLRSSSLFEDSDEFPLRKSYKSEFFVKSGDAEKSFESFCYNYRLVLGSLIERSWLSVRKDKPFLEGDRMFILLQKVPGHRETVELVQIDGDKTEECYFPSLSGVTKHNPLRPTNILSQANIGLNTTVIKGRYCHYINTDRDGKTKVSEKKSWGDALSNSVEFISLKRKTIVGSLFSKTGDIGSDEFLAELQGKLVKIMLRLEEDFSYRGFEWSFDSGTLYIYQNTRSAVHKRMEEFEVKTEWHPDSDIAISIKDENKVFGHIATHGNLVWIKPLPPPEDMVLSKYGSLSDETMNALLELENYILIGNRHHLVSEDDDPHEDLMGKYFYEWLGNIRGWVDTSGIKVELCTHYADVLIEEDIPVITVVETEIDEAKLEQLCPNKFELTDFSGTYRYEVRYSNEEFRMAVNAFTGEGQVCLFKQTRASALGVAPVFLSDNATSHRFSIMEQDL